MKVYEAYISVGLYKGCHDHAKQGRFSSLAEAKAHFETLHFTDCNFSDSEIKHYVRNLTAVLEEVTLDEGGEPSDFETLDTRDLLSHLR